MSLNVYVKGDIVTSTEIISQMALIMGSGSFSYAISLSVMAGIVVGLFKGFLAGGRLNIMDFIFPIFIIIIGIVPKTDIVIENDRTGAISKIDDIPIIIAGPLFLLTSFGHDLTTMMETNLGLTDTGISSDNKVLFATRAPLAYQEVLWDDDKLGSAAILPTSKLNVFVDMRNYISKCIVSDITKSKTSLSEQISAAVDSGLKSNSAILVAYSTGGEDTCGKMFDKLNADLGSKAFIDGINAKMSDHFAKFKGDKTMGPRYWTALGNLVEDRKQFIKALLWSRALDAGVANVTESGSGGASSVAFSDALKHRLQNNRGTVQVLFETMPMMIGFIEAWSFSIMPIMIIVMVFGSIGAKLAAKYFWLLVWIQLWHPTILIVMDFMDAKSRTLAGAAVNTINRYDIFINEIYRLEDTGYLMLGMSTMLSMFLIYGSSAIFGTAFQRAMTGGDHYDEKKVIPDSISRAATLAVKSESSYSPIRGEVGTDSQGHDIMLSFDKQITSSSTQAAVEAYIRGSGTQVTDNTAKGSTAAQTRQGGESHTKSNGTGFYSVDTTSLAGGKQLSFGDSHGASVSQHESLGRTAGVSGSIGPSIGGKTGLPTGFKAGGAIQDQEATGTSTDHSRTGSTQQGVNLRFDSSIRKQSEQSDRTDTTFSVFNADTDTTTQQTIGAKTDSKQINHSETDTESDSISTGKRIQSGQIGILEVSNGIARAGDGELFEDFKRGVSNMGLMGDVDNFMSNPGNARLLDKIFTSNDTGEEAKFVYSAMFLMQGLHGPLEGKSAEQLQVMDAYADEYIEAMMMSYPAVQMGAVDTSNLDAAPDPTDPTEAYEILAAQASAKASTIKASIADFPATDIAGAAVKAISQLGEKFDNLTGGMLNEVLHTSRTMLDDSINKFMNSDNAAAQMREGGFFSRLLGKSESQINLDQLSSYYKEQSLVDNDTDSDHKYRLATGQEMLDERMSDLQPLDPNPSSQSPVAEIFALSQLIEGGKELLKNNDLESVSDAYAAHISGAGSVQDYNEGINKQVLFFEGRLAELKAEHPELSGESYNTIQALSFDSTNSDAMRERLHLADQSYQMSALQHSMQEAIGFDLNANSDGQTPASFSGSSDVLVSSGLQGVADMVASGEGGYTSVHGLVPHNKRPSEDITDMTVGEVIQWQNSVKGNLPKNASTAVGRYQFINDTLSGLVYSQNVVSPNDQFNEETQDRLFKGLLEQDVGLSKYQSGEINDIQFLNNLAKTWAGVPVPYAQEGHVQPVQAGQSYYHGYAGNKATITLDNARAGVKSIKRDV